MVSERHVKIGDIIKIHFTGKLEDGSIFDSSEGKLPLQFKVGNGDVITGIDEAVIGMKLNQKKNVNLNSDKAYGPIEKEFIISIEKEKLPPNLELQVGYQLQIPNEDGEAFQVHVTKITDNRIELDGNHPLAGKNLIFNFEVVEIK